MPEFCILEELVWYNFSLNGTILVLDYFVLSSLPAGFPGAAHILVLIFFLIVLNSYLTQVYLKSTLIYESDCGMVPCIMYTRPLQVTSHFQRCVNLEQLPQV
jgi:hypothetical protein